MYIYQIGYGSYEDSGSVELSHTRKIGKDELQEMFVEATLELLLNRRDNLYWEEGKITEHDVEFFTSLYENKDTNSYWKKYIGDMTCEEFLEQCSNDPHNHHYANFSTIYREVAVIMIELYGFEEVKYEQTVYVNGWDEIVQENRSFETDCPILNKIKDEFWKRRNRTETLDTEG